MGIQDKQINRRQFFAGSALALSAAALVGCGGGSGSGSAAAGSTAAGSTAAATDGGFDGKTFIVGFDQEFPPYGYVGDDGEFTPHQLGRQGRPAQLRPDHLHLERLHDRGPRGRLRLHRPLHGK